MPRSLKEPVGLSPSTLSQTSPPARSESQPECDQRGAALAEGHRLEAVGHQVEQGAVLLDHAAPLARCRRRSGPSSRLHQSAIPSTRITERHLAHARRARAARSTVAASCGVGRVVGDHDELGVGAAALLAQGLDRDVLLGERRRDLGQHAGAVVDVDRHVVAGPGLAHRQHDTVGVRRLAGAAGVARAGCGRR